MAAGGIAGKRLLTSSSLVSIDPSVCRVGWIGTGVMGRYMCEHLIRKGGYQKVTVFNRTESKALPLVELGAKLVGSAQEVAENSDIVFTMVGYPADVHEIILGPKGILDSMKASQIIVDFTTSKPSLSCDIYEAASKRAVATLDAPVSGGDIGAKNGTLSIMIGGDAQVVNHILPMLKCFGKNIRHMGPAGMGQHTKMTNQIKIASTMVGVCESLLYAQRVGLDLNSVLEAIGSGAAASFSLSTYGPRIIQRNFDPGFYVHHFVKDLEIALDEARSVNLALPGLALAHQLYVSLKAQGHSTLGTQSLSLALERINSQEEH